MIDLRLDIPGACPYCSTQHSVAIHPPGLCPRVKAIDYHPDGTVKRIEFRDPEDT